MSTELTAEATRRVAMHQAAYAALHVLQGGASAVVMTTIQPGEMINALGFTHYSPCDTKASFTADTLRRHIIIHLAAVVAEHDLGGSVDDRGTGTSPSFETALSLARKFVEVTGTGITDATDKDMAAIAIIEECLDEAEALVKKEEVRISKVATALIERKTLTGADVAALVAE